MRIAFLLSPKPSQNEEQAVRALAAHCFARHEDVHILQHSSFVLLFLFPFVQADIVHIHGAARAWCTLFFRLFHPSTVRVVTFHGLAEFQEHHSFVGRMCMRLSTWVGCRLAHEITAAEHTTQYALYMRLHRFPTYIPNGVPFHETSLRLPRTGSPLLLYSADEGRQVTRVRRAFVAATKRKTLTALPVDETGTRGLALSLEHTKQRALLERASLLLVLHRFSSPAAARQLLCIGRPLLVLDTPEHREAFGSHVLYLRSAAKGELHRSLKQWIETRSVLEKNARKTALRTMLLYSWKHITEEYLRVYAHEERTPVFVDSLVPRTEAATA